MGAYTAEAFNTNLIHVSLIYGLYKLKQYFPTCSFNSINVKLHTCIIHWYVIGEHYSGFFYKVSDDK